MGDEEFSNYDGMEELSLENTQIEKLIEKFKKDIDVYIEQLKSPKPRSNFFNIKPDNIDPAAVEVLNDFKKQLGELKQDNNFFKEAAALTQTFSLSPALKLATPNSQNVVKQFFNWIQSKIDKTVPRLQVASELGRQAKLLDEQSNQKMGPEDKKNYRDAKEVISLQMKINNLQYSIENPGGGSDKQQAQWKKTAEKQIDVTQGKIKKICNKNQSVESIVGKIGSTDSTLKPKQKY